MGTLLGISFFWIIIFCFAVGSFLALPLIWYHTGFISKKLDTTNRLLAEIMQRLSPNEAEKKG